MREKKRNDTFLRGIGISKEEEAQFLTDKPSKKILQRVRRAVAKTVREIMAE